MLSIHHARERDADAAQCVMRRIQHLRAKVQCTAQAAAGKVLADIDTAGGGLQ